MKESSIEDAKARNRQMMATAVYFEAKMVAHDIEWEGSPHQWIDYFVDRLNRLIKEFGDDEDNWICDWEVTFTDEEVDCIITFLKEDYPKIIQKACEAICFGEEGHRIRCEEIVHWTRMRHDHLNNLQRAHEATLKGSTND